jgi:hypothetical protein
MAADADRLEPRADLDALSGRERFGPTQAKAMLQGLWTARCTRPRRRRADGIVRRLATLASISSVRLARGAADGGSLPGASRPRSSRVCSMVALNGAPFDRHHRGERIPTTHDRFGASNKAAPSRHVRRGLLVLVP